MKEQAMKTWMLILALAVGLLAMPALAEDEAPAADAKKGCDRTTLTADGATPMTMEEWIAASKKPTEWLTWGADARLREIFTANLLLDEEDRHFQRYRFRVWSKVTPMENVSINTRLVYEPRHFCQPSREAFTREGAYIKEWTLSEAIFDKMNVEVKKVAGLPVDLKIGRQDIIFGNGWLVLDGTPLDGSRTIFFDAARATVDLEDMKTKVDLIYIDQHADSDRWIEPFCDKDYHNMEQNERGVIVYVSNKSIENTQIDGYFIYKHDDRVIGEFATDGVAPWQIGNNADIYTLGGRIAGGFMDNWKYRAEFAHQFGRKNGEDMVAWGFNGRLEYHLNDEWKNNFRVGYEFLSGDDPETSQNEQFDPLWGRWPQFSEGLAYTVALENRPGETTNLHRINLGWTCHPTSKLEWCNDYNILFADEQSSYGTRGGIFTTFHSYRGQLLSSLLRYKFNSHISGHAIAEVFFPGEFYGDARDQVMGFFRYELTFTW